MVVHRDLALAPDGLPPDARPPRRPQIGDKLGQVSFVLGLTGKTTNRVNLAGAAASPKHIYLLHFAACHSHQRRAFTEGPKIDVERTLAVELTQGADTVADSRGENGEFRPRRQLLATLQFRRSEELDAHARGGRVGSQVQCERRGNFGICEFCFAAVCIELRHTGQIHAAAFRTQPFACELRKCENQVGHSVGPCIEEIQIEVECLACLGSVAVEVSRAKYKWPRPVRQTAWSGRYCRGLKQARIRAARPPFAFTRTGALRHTSNAAEDCAERPSEDI